MNKLLFGTTNPAKIAQVRGALAPLGISVEGLGELATEVVEDGKTASENARKKARAYAEAFSQPIFAMDNALYFEGLPDDDQPGLHVRRIKGDGERPTDQALLNHYAHFINERGGEIEGWWEFAVCIATPEGSFEESLIKSPRRFVGKASKKIVAGYPLESIQVDPQTGKYISEMTQDEQDAFWQRVIGRPLIAFVQHASIKLGL